MTGSQNRILQDAAGLGTGGQCPLIISSTTDGRWTSVQTRLKCVIARSTSLLSALALRQSSYDSQVVIVQRGRRCWSKCPEGPEGPEGVCTVQAKWCVDLEAQQKGLDVPSSFQIEDTGRESGDEAWGLSSESQSPPGAGYRDTLILRSTCCTTFYVVHT